MEPKRRFTKAWRRRPAVKFSSNGQHRTSHSFPCIFGSPRIIPARNFYCLSLTANVARRSEPTLVQCSGNINPLKNVTPALKGF